MVWFDSLVAQEPGEPGGLAGFTVLSWRAVVLMLKLTGRRSRSVGMALAVVLVAAGAAWAGGSPMAVGAAEEVPMCFGMPATIVGTAGDDVLTGTPGDDVIVGLEGTDTISATDGGTDRVCGGPNDLSRLGGGVPRYEEVTLEGSGFVDGGSGLDSIEVDFPSSVQIVGGSNPTVHDDRGRLWREKIVVEDGMRVDISSGDGPDSVDVRLGGGGATLATVDAGAGHDVVKCSGDFAERCELHGGRGTGNDRLDAGGDVFTVELFGGSGNDVLAARDSNIEMDGGPGKDALYSRGETETLRGGSGADRLAATGTVYSAGPHILQGGTGDDYLVGNVSPERFGGGDGSDTVRAGGGNDTAWGGTGPDVLGGAGGRDSLYGNAGVDANYGGSGSDLCRSPSRGPRAHSCQR